MIKVVRNKSEAKKEMAKFAGDYDYDISDMNFKRKYPCFVMGMINDLTGMRGGTATALFWFLPITKETKKRILESLL